MDCIEREREFIENTQFNLSGCRLESGNQVVVYSLQLFGRPVSDSADMIQVLNRLSTNNGSLLRWTFRFKIIPSFHIGFTASFSSTMEISNGLTSLVLSLLAVTSVIASHPNSLPDVTNQHGACLGRSCSNLSMVF